MARSSSRALTSTFSSRGYEIVPAGRYATLSVSDNGCGIEPPRAWPGLRTVLHQETRKGDIGLRSGACHRPWCRQRTRRIHRRHQYAWPGTTISLYFPLVDGEERREPVLAAPRGDARVLIVDDETILLRTGRRVLAPRLPGRGHGERGGRLRAVQPRGCCLGPEPVRPGHHGHVAGRTARRPAGHRTDPRLFPHKRSSS